MAKIGIDLGTTYSCVCYVDENGEPRVLENSEDQPTTPSVVFFGDGNVIVGENARNEGALEPKRVVERVKNYMGDPNYSFFLEEEGQTYSASAVSALILKKLVKDAEAKLSVMGEEIEGAIITCPAYFGMPQRVATKEAGEHVTLSNGQPLRVFDLLDEPVAAAIAYCKANKLEQENKKILVYDLGGGTFDCTIAEMSVNGEDRKVKVITTNGNHQLGGKDWDARLTELVKEKYAELTGVDFDSYDSDEEEAECRQWFSENMEKLKKSLTDRESKDISIRLKGAGGKVNVTREEFEERTSDLLQQTIDLINQMFADKGMSMDEIDEILLVGGSTFMPQVRNRLEAEYTKPINQYEPNKAVAMGAAIVANSYVAQSEKSEEQSQGGGSWSLGGSDNSFVRDPDEGGVDVEQITNKTYGIRLYNGVTNEAKCTNLIFKDTGLPTSATTAKIFQSGELRIGGDEKEHDSVSILVLQNESFEKEVSLDMCTEIYEEEPLNFGESLPGTTPIEVVMSIDMSGVLSLDMIDITPGKSGKKYHIQPRMKGQDSTRQGMDKVGGWTLSD